MDREEQLIALLATVIICMTMRRRCPAAGTRPWILRRARLGACHALVQELVDEDPDAFKNFVRMTPESFNDLYGTESDPTIIDRHDTNTREATRDRFQRDNN